MDRALFVLFAVVGGGFIAIQAPVNARLRVAVESPLVSAWLSFVVGTVLLGIAIVGTRAGGGLQHAGSAPWWAWIGGVAGAVLVTAMLVAVPRLGATTTFVAVIAGQLLVVMVLDRFGWLGLPQRAFTTERMLALALMLAALVMLLRE